MDHANSTALRDAEVTITTTTIRLERELNKSWRDSVDHSQWNIRRLTEG